MGHLVMRYRIVTRKRDPQLGIEGARISRPRVFLRAEGLSSLEAERPGYGDHLPRP